VPSVRRDPPASCQLHFALPAAPLLLGNADKQGINRFLLDEFLEHMLRHFEIGRLRQDFQFELVRRPFSALLALELNPIFSRDFACNIDVRRPAPRPFQVDSANNFSASVCVLQVHVRPCSPNPVIESIDGVYDSLSYDRRDNGTCDSGFHSYISRGNLSVEPLAKGVRPRVEEVRCVPAALLDLIDVNRRVIAGAECKRRATHN